MYTKNTKHRATLYFLTATFARTERLLSDATRSLPSGRAITRHHAQQERPMTLIRSLAHRALSMLVGDLPAGACVPENGQCCAPGLYFNCWGTCVTSRHC
jgi:hypothetical protein